MQTNIENSVKKRPVIFLVVMVWYRKWVSLTKVSNVFNDCYFNTHFDFFDETNEIIVSCLCCRFNNKIEYSL
jgi:hypothetical protein